MIIRLLLICAVSLVSSAVFSLGIDEATIYLPFEGTIGPELSAECWTNLGNAGLGENPGIVGTTPDAPLGTVTVNGLKGQAYDGTSQSPQTAANTYAWGLLGYDSAHSTPVEYTTTNIWSFTVTGWMKNGIPNSRICRCAAFELNYTNGDKIEIKCGKNGSFVKSEANYPADEWVFFAVTYDGTVPFVPFEGIAAEDNLKFYYGTADQPVQLSLAARSITNEPINEGWLTRDPNGSMFVIGNVNYQSTRPFTGYIDELRVWAGGPGPGRDTTVPNNYGTTWEFVLTQEELEMVRLYDAPVDNCLKVHVQGYALGGDVNNDCNVDLLDIEDMAANWLGCNDPENLDCF
jgi:hypothetical protein